MGAFAVFGARMEIAKKREKYKKVKTRHPETGASTTTDVRMTAQEVFDDMCEQISPSFDAPQFAEQWADVARTVDGIRVDYIAVHVPQTTSAGQPIKSAKTGRELRSWEPWNGMQANAQLF